MRCFARWTSWKIPWATFCVTSLLAIQAPAGPASPPELRTAAAPHPRQPSSSALPSLEQAPVAPKAAPPQGAPKGSKPEAQLLLPPSERAWVILREGLAEKSLEKRVKAVHALGLLQGSAEAETAAQRALKDEKAEVRAAAATALGSMRASHSNTDLEAALDDTDPGVMLAAANSLLLLKDTPSAYDVFYGVLTGMTRTSKGVIRDEIHDQQRTLHDPKKMAELGIEQGIGFIPFAGFGYEAVKAVMKSDASGSAVRAAAAKKLAGDPSAATAKALVAATRDKNWLVRAAALEALSERGDKSLAGQVTQSLDDQKDEVRFTAAACIAHLSDLPAAKRQAAGPADAAY